MREISFGLDGSFSWESMVARYNSDLANDYGNLASRVLSMIGRYLDGVIPEPPHDEELLPEDKDLMSVQRDRFAAMEAAIDAVAPHDALKEAWGFVRKANAYVEAVTPWALAKDPAQKRRLEVVLYLLADSLRLLALMTSPATPNASSELWQRLGLEGDVEQRNYPEDARWGLLPAGAKVRTGEPLFPRLEATSGA
jgi:methionyl-tRNA synthetase